MSSGHPPHLDPTPTPRDIEFMALTLEGLHGRHAAEVAEFFASMHVELGDAGRAWAWVGVAELVRMREKQRLKDN